MSHLILHPKQKEIVKSRARFKAIRAGRKGGKTVYEVENIVFKATAGIEKLNIVQKEFKTGRKVLYIAPTRIQAETIVWTQLKNRLHGIGKANEQKLTMRVPNEDGEETTIYVGGWENRENYRGLTDVIHITFDEVDTLRNFFLGWKDIFRPLFIDTKGTADFIGTPKKENPNLRRLEKEFSKQPNADCFHFTSFDNPHVPKEELDLMREEYKGDMQSYQQEVLAQHVENAGALFGFNALIDMFSNTVDEGGRYLIVDIADDGSDKTKFSFWNGLNEYRRDTYEGMNTESIVNQIREDAIKERIPYSHIAVDAIGVGAGVASNSLLNGIVGYKSSFAPIKTDENITMLPNAGKLPTINLTSDYKNLRSQCIFTLASLVNNHEVASDATGADKDTVIEELSAYQDASKGDGKRMATAKEDVKAIIGRSPDDSDCFVAGTLVDTPTGKVKIEEIKRGDKIKTPFGEATVKEKIEKETKELFILDNNLIGTGNHKIFSGSGFSTLDSYNMRTFNYYINSNYNKIIWKMLSLLSTKIKSIGFRGVVNTSIIAHTKTELDKEELHYTDKSGKTQAEGKSPMALLFTILTATLLIMTRTIWLALRMVGIVVITAKNIGGIITIKPKTTLIEPGMEPQSGTGQKKEESGTRRIQKDIGLKLKRKMLFARIAGELTRGIEKEVSAVRTALRNIIIELKGIMKIGNVSFVDYLLVSGSLNKPSVVQEVVLQSTGGTRVYTLSLDKHFVYVANGVLVGNCFIMRMYFEIKEKMLPNQSPENNAIVRKQQTNFKINRANFINNSTK